MLERILIDKYARWDSVLQKGCCDPCHEDGLTLMKIREDIIRIKQQIDCHYPYDAKPGVYYLEEPPVVQARYMARSDEIRRNAKKTFWILKNNKLYIWILRQLIKKSLLSPETSGFTPISAFTQWVKEKASKNRYTL